jgi:hypothetical protein
MATTPLNKQFVVYFDEKTMHRVKQFSKKHGMSMNQLIREGVEQRMTDDNQYVAGFNDAVKKAMIVVEENNATKMRFPSGKSFAELINEDLERLIKDEVVEGE